MAAYLLALALAGAVAAAPSQRGYTERLYTRPLWPGAGGDRAAAVLHTFEFAHARGGAGDSDAGAATFPPEVAAALAEYGVEHVRVSIASNREWDTAGWGVPPPEVAHLPPGLHVAASFADAAGQPPQYAAAALPRAERWERLLRRLSGLLCCALGGAGSSGPAYGGARTPSGVPRTWYTRIDDAAQRNYSSGTDTSPRKYATYLPTATSCGENVAALVRLLPCRRHAGLVTLLQAREMFTAAPWRALAWEASVSPSDGAVEWRQLAAMVVEHWESRSGGRGSDVEPLSTLLGDSGPSSAMPCPAARSTGLLVWHSELGTGGEACVAGHARFGACWQMQAAQDDSAPLDAAVVLVPMRQRDASARAARRPAACVSVHRQWSEHGLGTGTVLTRVTNDCGDAPVAVAYVQLWPWFMELDLSSHVVWLARQDADAAHAEVAVLARGPPHAGGDDGVSFAFQPAARRAGLGTSTHEFALPPGASAYISVRASLPLLAVEEHPADTHRGLDVPAGRVRACSSAQAAAAAAALQDELQFAYDWRGRRVNTTGADACCGDCVLLHTAALVVEPASPDFSMPYNVMVLSMTTLAYVAGAVLNATGRKPRSAAAAGKAGAAAGAARASLLARVRARLCRRPAQA